MHYCLRIRSCCGFSSQPDESCDHRALTRLEGVGRGGRGQCCSRSRALGGQRGSERDCCDRPVTDEPAAGETSVTRSPPSQLRHDRPASDRSLARATQCARLTHKYINNSAEASLREAKGFVSRPRQSHFPLFLRQSGTLEEGPEGHWAGAFRVNFDGVGKGGGPQPPLLGREWL